MTRQRFVDRQSARAACAVPATGTRPVRPVGRDPFPLSSCRARRTDRGWPSATRCGVTAGRSRRGEGGAAWRCSPLRPARASHRRGHDVPPAPRRQRVGAAARRPWRSPRPGGSTSPPGSDTAAGHWRRTGGFHRRIHRSSRPLTRAGVAQRRRQHAADAWGSQRRGGRYDRFSRRSPVPVSPETRPPSAGSASGPRGLRSQQRLGSRLPAVPGVWHQRVHAPPGPIGRTRSARTLQSEVPCSCRPGGVSLSQSRSPSP